MLVTIPLPCWGLAITAPSAEAKVSSSLERHKIPHHVFRYRDRVVRRGKITEILRPAFRPYVFVQILEDAFWHRIREMFGVLGFVRYDDGESQTVMPVQVDDLVKRATDGVLNDVSPVSKFAHGDRIRFVGENRLFFGNVGYYDHPLGVGKAWVQLPWASGMAGMQVDERDLERMEKKKKRQRSQRSGRRRHRPLNA